MSVNFYEAVEDSLLKFAVIVAKTNGKWVFCKHKSRDTLEIPGGHREPNENIIDTAKRELIEENGAIDFDLKPICVYSVIEKDNFDGEETFGLLCYADKNPLAKLIVKLKELLLQMSCRRIGLIRQFNHIFL